MEYRKFSLASFIIGILVGLLVAVVFAGVSVMSFYNAMRSGTWDDKAGIVRDIGEQIRTYAEEERSTSVHGTVTKVEEGAIEIEARQALGVEVLRFRYDANTVVVRLNNDDESTEVPIAAHDLQLGEGISILTNEPIGSVADQYAVKIVQI